MPIFNVVYCVGRGKSRRNVRIQTDIPKTVSQDGERIYVTAAAREHARSATGVEVIAWAPVPSAFVAPARKEEEDRYSWLTD